MFWHKKIDTRMINPASKMSLKMSCLVACNNDIDKAEKLYKFLSDGVETLPDFDVPQPTIIQQVQDGAGKVFGWVKENREDIMQAWGFIQSMRNGKVAETVAEIPPIPKP
jgi:hypothetical protein